MCLTGYLMSEGHWCPEVEVCHSDNDVEESGGGGVTRSEIDVL
jgi:hypothetical protein